MKRITILGWYGTETIGDRAILDGIFITLNDVFGKFKVYLASLYPFFSERTLLEDEGYYKISAPGIEIEIVDECRKKELYRAIKKSDYVLMGGGPIMDLNQLTIISDAFRYAKRCKKITAIFGAGLGPLKGKYYICETERLLKYSDYIFLRDELSCNLVKELYGECFTCECFGDPAIISIKKYKDHNKSSKAQYSVCNLREYPEGEYGEVSYSVQDTLLDILDGFAEKSKRVILVPMHTFDIGGDDRVFLSYMKNSLERKNIEMLEHPISLAETYEMFFNADTCLGMRYHSVVMQTILNGNNYIVDYTDPQNGKIAGFLKTFHLEECYQSRYLNLKKQIAKRNDFFCCNYNDRNVCDLEQQCNNVLDRYCTFWKSLL